MKKISTVRIFGSEIFKEQKLTIGVDLGDRWSFYCVLDEAGKIILEQKVPTTPESLKQIYSRMPQSHIALETGTHSMGKPAVNGAGTRSDRSARTKSAMDQTQLDTVARKFNTRPRETLNWKTPADMLETSVWLTY